ncbi:Hypothetical predicted protein [Mytilus galloprovincialis]|uniref:Reverse transcriptase domain-containing protein n=1 Tax=Mytilus galloprovincialis TaxID=29158 RepID=A0A8B6HN39_MYTGA|nr:Hypothetical predicted protein [Mytilus galloprovincialis]
MYNAIIRVKSCMSGNCKRKQQYTGVKSKEGKRTSEINVILDPLHPISEEDVDLPENIIDEIELGELTAEVKRALKKTQNGKSAGIDSVITGLIKADINLTTKKIAEIFNSLWEKEKWPSDWRKRMILKIFKKSDMTDDNN